MKRWLYSSYFSFKSITLFNYYLTTLLSCIFNNKPSVVNNFLCSYINTCSWEIRTIHTFDIVLHFSLLKGLVFGAQIFASLFHLLAKTQL